MTSDTTQPPFSDMVHLRAQFVREEDIRQQAYDDQNGRTITPGSVVHGHPTVGIGRALDVHGLSLDEIDYLFSNDIREVVAELDQHLPWWRTLVPPRQAVLIDMAFNMGIGVAGQSGLLGWPNTLAAVRTGQYDTAAQGMRSSLWARQTGTRAEKLADQMETGEWQT